MNSYRRFNGGEPHTDANTSEQLTAKNIAVQFVDVSVLESDTGRLDITTVGEGDAVIFLDGTAIPGRWEKPNRGDRTTFFDANRDEIKFNAGVTWIEAVPTGNEVSY